MESSGSLSILNRIHESVKPILPALSLLRKQEEDYSGKKKRERAYSLTTPLTPLKNPILAAAMQTQEQQRSLSMEAVDTRSGSASITSPQSNESLNTVSPRSSTSSQSSSDSSGESAPKQSGSAYGNKTTPNKNAPSALSKQDSFTSTGSGSTTKTTPPQKKPSIKLEPLILKDDPKSRHNSHNSPIEFHDIGRTRSNSTSDPKRSHKKSMTSAIPSKWCDLSTTTKTVLEKKKKEERPGISQTLLQHHFSEYSPAAIYGGGKSPYMQRTSSLVIHSDKIAKESSPLFRTMKNHDNNSPSSPSPLTSSTSNASSFVTPSRPANITIPNKENLHHFAKNINSFDDNSESSPSSPNVFTTAPKISDSPKHFIGLKSSNNDDPLSASTGSNSGSSSHQTPNSPLPACGSNRGRTGSFAKTPHHLAGNSPASTRPSSTSRSQRNNSNGNNSFLNPRNYPQVSIKSGEILSPQDLESENRQNSPSSSNYKTPTGKSSLHVKTSDKSKNASPSSNSNNGQTTLETLLAYRFGSQNNEFFHYTETDRESDTALYQVYIDFRKQVKSKRDYSYLVETLNVYANYWNALEEGA